MGKYEFRSRVRYSECGEDCRLHLSGVVNYFQDAATFQGEELGIGIPWMKERSLAWILASWQIITDHMPRLGEMITIRTWPYSFSGFYGLRNLELLDESGARAAWANSVWVLMDTDARRPVKVPQQMVQLYGQEEKLGMDYAPRRIAVPEGGEMMEAFTVHRGHLDSRIYETRVEYREQTFLGDVIRPLVVKAEDAITVSLLKEKHENANACAIVRFSPPSQ